MVRKKMEIGMSLESTNLVLNDTITNVIDLRVNVRRVEEKASLHIQYVIPILSTGISQKGRKKFP